jgi:hypothetical protein
MGGSGASLLYLRSGAASGVMPLGLSAMYTAQAAGRRTGTQHGTKKRRIRETRLGKRGRGDSHADGGGACTRRTKRRTTPVRHRAPAALGRHDPAAPNAHGATPPSHRTSLALWRLILVRDVLFGGAALFFFCAALNKRPSLCGVSWWSAGFAQGGAQCRFGVVTGRFAVISRRSDVTSNPL